VQLFSLSKSAQIKEIIHSFKKHQINKKVFPLHIGSALHSDHESKYNVPPTTEHAKKMASAYEINSAATECGGFMKEYSELFFQSG
jgi:hypothetical protein